ncbi:MAG: hypothetical protein LBC07_04300 [Elusimicrobiota bacterium]|jgi:hypothetical protein|nr:hypothetical protein [Elusimicrobiota bacterium]
MSIGGAIDTAINFLSRKQETEFNVTFESPFTFPIDEINYLNIKLSLLFSKILRDCFARSEGISDKIKPLFWDTVVKAYGKANADKGLISLLSTAMAAQTDLFLIYKNGVLRQADEPLEIEQIMQSFKNGNAKVGYWFSFKDFDLSKILRLLFSFQLAIMATTFTGLNVSKALQFKINDLRKLVADTESEMPTNQVKKINEGLKAGKSIVIDALDKIETTHIEMSSVESGIKFINGLIAEALNMPLSYVNGELTTGISTTGESDSIAIERGLESIFNSVFKPSVDEIFKLDIRFVSENWRILLSSGSALQTIESLSEDIVPLAVKQRMAEAILKDFYKDGERKTQ